MGDSNLIEVCIRYLRLRLEAEGEPHLIQTVREVSYVLRYWERIRRPLSPWTISVMLRFRGGPLFICSSLLSSFLLPILLFLQTSTEATRTGLNRVTCGSANDVTAVGKTQVLFC